MFSNKKTAKPGKTPDNYKQQIHNKLDSALEGLDIDIFTNHHDDSVIFQKKSQTPDDCDNDTTIPYVDDQSSPIHSQFNPFVTPWAKPTLPTSIRPLRLSFVQKLVIPLSKKPAPVAVNPLLKTPQQLASLYPKLPTSTLATASIATTATSAPTVTSTTSTVVSSAIVPVTTTAATAGATATTIPGTISTTTSTSSSAMPDVGIGVRQLSRLMTIMGVPGSSERTMKKRERELFKPMVDVARDSCHEAITKECSETR
ncbi:unnamed protein product [Mytilus coruscus]|uniref:Mutator-like transposase domain-containing protein n=1 Tax=Mytilus coruscus TaxID=42192 RepID=A0A6J8EMW0_MYTCO|nr:unnamed protein product [Mytilus coruscus]